MGFPIGSTTLITPTSVSFLPITVVRDKVNKVVIGEDRSVVPSNSDYFLKKAGSNVAQSRQIAAGEFYTFERTIPYNKGDILGYIEMVTPATSTTFFQDESEHLTLLY